MRKNIQIDKDNVEPVVWCWSLQSWLTGSRYSTRRSETSDDNGENDGADDGNDDYDGADDDNDDYDGIRWS